MSAAATTAPLDATRTIETPTVTVQAQRDGIHDSLWRIAQRYLGDGNRWPEIYRLNRGLPQADGARLTDPSLIRPGWTLRLPSPATAAPNRAHSPAPPATPRTPHLPPRHTQAPSSPPRGIPTPAPATPPAPPAQSAGPASGSPSDVHTHASAPPTHDDPSIDLGDGLYVSLGLAAAISGALVSVRRRNRRWYAPGSGRRDDLPVAPVVRSLHLAHLRATTPPAPDDAEDSETGGSTTRAEEHGDEAEEHPETARRRDPRCAAPGRARPRGHPAGGIDLSVAHGLGLVGPGAREAARAMLLDALTTGAGTPGGDGAGRRVDALIPAADLDLLAGSHPSGGLPPRLHVAADLPAALDQLESAILTRARRAERHAGDRQPREAGAIVLFTRVPSDVGRLQGVLDNGAAVAITGVLLGQWRAGTSVYVQTDGVVSAAHGPAAPRLGARLFSLPETATRTLLDLLHDADQPRATASSIHTTGSDPRATGATTGAGDRLEGTDSTTPTREPAAATDLIHAPVTVDPNDNTLHPPDPGAIPDPRTPADSQPAPPRDAELRPGRRGGKSKTPLQLQVLGPLSLMWRKHPHPADEADKADAAGDNAVGDRGQYCQPQAVTPVEIIGALSPRVRELLVALAVHPDGITRDRLADTLWPDTPPERPFNSLNTTLGRLRTALTRATGGQLTEIVLSAGDQHRLDPTLVEVDYAAFAAAAHARQRATTDTDRAQAWQQMLATYRGELAEGVGAEWLETPREAIRRDAIDAATGLARLVVREDPRQALELLETARARDPYNEALYGDIMRVQRRLRQADAITRTLNLLTTRLAELGETPSTDTAALAKALQQAASRPSGSPPPSDAR